MRTEQEIILIVLAVAIWAVVLYGIRNRLW